MHCLRNSVYPEPVKEDEFSAISTLLFVNAVPVQLVIFPRSSVFVPFFEVGIVRMSPMVQRAIDERGCAEHTVPIFFAVPNFSDVATSVVICQYAFGHSVVNLRICSSTTQCVAIIGNSIFGENKIIMKYNIRTTRTRTRTRTICNVMNTLHTFVSNVDETLDAQDEYAATTRMSHMYAFILICVIAMIVLVITIRNLSSDTVTTGGYVICCIILTLFVISVGLYLFNLFGAFPVEETAIKGGDSGPVIRIHYV